jgi:hypothetical protein
MKHKHKHKHKCPFGGGKIRFAPEKDLPYANARVCETCPGQFRYPGRFTTICMCRGFSGVTLMGYEGERRRVMHDCPFMLEMIMANEEDAE